MSKGSRKIAVARWAADGQFEGQAGSGNRLIMGSKDGAMGFSPMELVLVGLAGCTGMDVLDILRKKRQDVTGFEVRVGGERAAEHPKVYTRIEIEYVVRGNAVSPEAVSRAVELSQGKYCSVSAMLAKSAQVVTTIRIEDVETAR